MPIRVKGNNFKEITEKYWLPKMLPKKTLEFLFYELFYEIVKIKILDLKYFKYGRSSIK